jgi:Replication-relaxation
MPATHPQNVRLEERDVSLLRDLLELRVLTLDHVRTLHFPGRIEMAKKRVYRLKAAGIISERPRRIGEPSILHLTWKGYGLLRAGGHVGDDSHLSPKTFSRRMTVSNTTLAHELMIGDVRAAFALALRDNKRFSLLSFDVWPRRYDFTVTNGHRRVPVKPDGRVQISEKHDSDKFQYDYFLEADTGTENLGRVVEKCVNYREYFRSGGYAVFCGGRREDAKLYPFRVLVVCKSEERRNNLAEQLLRTEPPFSKMVLVTTHTACVRDPLGDIWLTPAAYKAAAPESVERVDTGERDRQHRNKPVQVDKLKGVQLCSIVF